MKPYAFVDLDGTIINSMYRQYRVFQAACETYEYQVPVSYEMFASRKREGYSTKSVMEEYGIFDVRVNDYWKEHIEDICWLKLDQIYGDAEAFLRLAQKRYKVIILTARRNSSVKSMLQKEDIGRFLSDIIIISPDSPFDGKRDFIAGMFHENGILVGDTEVEYQLGRELGIHTYLLNRGFRSEAFWKRKGVRSFEGLDEISREIYRDWGD